MNCAFEPAKPVAVDARRPAAAALAPADTIARQAGPNRFQMHNHDVLVTITLSKPRLAH